jgi:L-methionine (R)-S-oxide reductase
MFHVPDLADLPKAALYEELAKQLDSVLSGEPDAVANLANAAAVIFHGLPRLNWAGFYLLKGGELVLGPFQGKPACIRIPLGRGVCGTAAATGKTLLVEDVHAFPGHIACDADSASELVVPLVRDGRVLGVLDLDSPATSRFDAEDATGCEALAAVILKHTAL